ncbi:hypothetical protein GYMLUDRAFT_246620 [Collybiopsis luxurians FD-317 M1]|uniref:Uncharacterized protein n=1 Tax=Collybiopsis luxurians FD-317 M1 TaxID=944289 RepID=A0A0D0BRV6_9AGAR|nr:hypothetical protein GYMLUDRAFT_246620 [Collybiopsis luxurians FD-317 M1]
MNIDLSETGFVSSYHSIVTFMLMLPLTLVTFPCSTTILVGLAFVVIQLNPYVAAAPASTLMARAEKTQAQTKIILSMPKFDAPWLKQKLVDTVKPNEQVKSKFASPLTNLQLGSPLSSAVNSGNKNLGIYTVTSNYKSHLSTELVAKFLEETDREAFVEVHALQMVSPTVNLYVDAGMFPLPVSVSNSMVAILAGAKPGQLAPLAVMIKKPGLPLIQTPEWQKADAQTRLKLQLDTIHLMCKSVGLVARNHHIYRGDNFDLNVLVEFKPEGMTIDKVHLVDFGAGQLYEVVPRETSVYEKACNEYWRIYWGAKW